MAFLNTTDDYLNDIKLQNGKTLSDSVSCIDWSTKSQDHFACSLWDGTVKIYQVGKNQYANTYKNETSFLVEKATINVSNPWPVTYCNWSGDGNSIFVGTSRGQIKAIDMNTGHILDIGTHSAPINFIKSIPEYGNTLLTSAYQNNIHFWNLNTKRPSQTVSFGRKVFKTAYGGEVLATGMSEQKIGLANIRALQRKKDSDSSELGKYSQIQTIQVSRNGKFLGLGTIDGRVNISMISSNSNMEYSWKSHITFKAHKTGNADKQSDPMILYPVNSLTFHPISDEWFSTCGADGTMHFWNHVGKSKIKSFNYNGNPVCYSSVSPGGNYIAYALGNDWHIGQEGAKWRPRIAVHEIVQAQIKAFK